MVEIPASKHSAVSFADCELIEFTLTSKCLSCKLDGCFVDGEDAIQSEVTMRVENWTSCHVTRFDERGQNPISIEISQAGRIREICESRISQDRVTLAGFHEETGHWQTLEFWHPTTTIIVS